mgnify:CR=1 FL=1
MKIRIKGNSIRLRLTKTEIANFGEQGIIEEETQFPGGSRLCYALISKEGIENTSASFHDNRITVWVPEKIKQTWTSTDLVGFDEKILLENGQLLLLIEKDFVCLDNTLEDQSDNYPNPNAVC